MEPKDGNILEPKDIACIEHTIASGKLGSQQAAALIEAAGDLSMNGITFEEMIKGLASNPFGYVRARRIELEQERNTRKELVVEYQNAIDSFLERLESIDALHATYAKINYTDVRLKPLQVHGEPTHPNRYNREIEIDEIILECTM